MEIIEVATGFRKEIVISEAVADDYKVLTKKRFSFVWKTVATSATVYKLQIEGNSDILGVMGLVDWPEEKEWKSSYWQALWRTREKKSAMLGLPAV
jgi:hypothetical protein